MAHPFPAQDLACPDLASCPVADPSALDEAPRVDLQAGEWLYRVYDTTYGFGSYNPAGDARFSPFDDADGDRVGSFYVAENEAGALLETVFHDVEPDVGVVLEDTLRVYALAHLTPPSGLRLVDLRDPVLVSLGVRRSGVAASGPEHYPCTRRIARHFHDRGADGLVWNSRQAEFHRSAGRRVLPTDVAVIFGDLTAGGPGPWVRVGPAVISLVADRGRTMVDRIAEELGVTVVDS